MSVIMLHDYEDGNAVLSANPASFVVISGNFLGQKKSCQNSVEAFA